MRLNIVVALLTVLFSINSAICQESTPALKDNTFVMAINIPEIQPYGKLLRLIHTEVFKRLGIKVEFRDYPSKRASVEADAGNVDGEPVRPYQYADKHPNLIRVEESVLNVKYSAFAVQPSIPQLNGWDSLKGTDYRVGYRRGNNTCETNLPKLIRRESLADITEPVQGLKQLVSGRTDLFVDEESSVLTLLQTPELKDSKIRLAGLMESFPIYPYLHKKHASLAPKMAEIIKAMKAEGLIDKYRVMVDKEFGKETGK